MDDDKDFFGDAFQDPDDDPLLGGDASPDSPFEDDDSTQGAPSWMTDPPENGRTRDSAGQAPNAASGPEADSDADPGEDTGPDRREIVVDQRAGDGLDALNEAVEQGWRLARITLASADAPSATPQGVKRFVAVLEEDGPQSLFDFGPGS